MSEVPVVFHFHPTSGEFVGTSYADADPMDDGRWVVPASATLIAPNEPAAGFALIFEEDSWQQVEDHRGETWWDKEGNPVSIAHLGDPASEGLSATAPEQILTPEMVDTERDRRIVDGFTFQGVQFQSRPEDRENIAGAKSLATDAIALGAAEGELSWRQRLNPTGPEVFTWIAADNSLVPMDAPTVVQFAYAAVDHKESMIFAARAIKNLDPIPADYTDDIYWP